MNRGSQLTRRQFAHRLGQVAAGATIAPTLAETLAFGQGYPPAPNYTPLTNWLTSNNNTSVIDAFLGPRRNIFAYYPPDDNMRNLTLAQAGVLASSVQQWAGVLNTSYTGGSLNSAIRSLGQANYQVDGWVTLVTLDWSTMYSYWETWAAAPYFCPMGEDCWYDCWDAYYYDPVVFPVYSLPPAGSWPYDFNFNSIYSEISNAVQYIRNLVCLTGAQHTALCNAVNKNAKDLAALAGIIALLGLYFPELAPITTELALGIAAQAGAWKAVAYLCGC